VGFALQGFRVYAPDYRLAPENQFPAAVDDAVAVYRALLGAGHESQGIVAAGESAGGGLALSMMLALRTAGIPLPRAPPFFSMDGSAATGESIRSNSDRCAMFCGSDVAASARYYLGDTEPYNPLASPCMRISPGFLRCSFTSARTKYCLTIRRVSPNALAPRTFP